MADESTGGIKRRVRRILRREVDRLYGLSNEGSINHDHLEMLQTIVRTYTLLETKLPTGLEKPKDYDRLDKRETKDLINLLRKPV